MGGTKFGCFQPGCKLKFKTKPQLNKHVIICPNKVGSRAVLFDEYCEKENQKMKQWQDVDEHAIYYVEDDNAEGERRRGYEADGEGEDGGGDDESDDEAVGGEIVTGTEEEMAVVSVDEAQGGEGEGESESDKKKSTSGSSTEVVRKVKKMGHKVLRQMKKLDRKKKRAAAKKLEQK